MPKRDRTNYIAELNLFHAAAVHSAVIPRCMDRGPYQLGFARLAAESGRLMHADWCRTTMKLRVNLVSTIRYAILLFPSLALINFRFPIVCFFFLSRLAEVALYTWRLARDQSTYLSTSVVVIAILILWLPYPSFRSYVRSPNIVLKLSMDILGW